MRKRRRLRLLGWLLLLAAAFVAAFPYLAAREPLRGWMLRAVLPKIHGTAAVGGASLGWLSPIGFEQIEIRSPDGLPTLVIPVLSGDRPLWRYLVSPRQLGSFRIERPQVNLVAGAQGSNLEEVFSVGKPAKAAAAPPDLSMGLEIVDAGFSFRGPGEAQPWGIQGVHLALALEPSSVTPSHAPELVLRKGRVLDREAITPPMCRDLLKYAAPVLADVSRVHGSLSLDLDEWRVPLGAPRQARGSGVLTIHALEVDPGPLTQALAGLLQLRPATVRLVDNSAVRFSMADGRVEHHNLVFQINDAKVQTDGSVGLDQSLDLVATISLSGKLLGNGPLAEAIRKHPIRLPLRGTLSRPRIEPLGSRSPDQALPDVLDRLLDRATGEGGLLDRLLKRPKDEKQTGKGGGAGD